MLILVIGDVIGGPGRHAVSEVLPSLTRNFGIDMVVANAENIAGGIGVTPQTAKELLDTGIDVLTSGNHIWAHRDILPLLDDDSFPLLRPLNYPPGVPGRGYMVTKDVMVVSLIGRTFFTMDLDCPFRAMDHLLESVKEHPKIIIVDFHAEATSEKMAMGRYLDGRVTAVMGTHTHVGTIDSQILPCGTAFVTDIGMTGPVNSIIGDEVGPVVDRFLTAIPHRLTAAKGKTMFTAILLKVDDKTGKTVKIDRVSQEVG